MRNFLVVLVLLVAAGVGLGFYLDWFGLTVNTDKMNEDTAGAKDNLRELGKKIKDKTNATVAKAKEKNGTPAADVKTATGKVKTVEAADNHFLMTTGDNAEMTVYTDASSKLRLNDEEFKLDRLKVGDEVKVGYDLKEGKNLATSVTVKRN